MQLGHKLIRKLVEQVLLMGAQTINYSCEVAQHNTFGLFFSVKCTE
jgi:hypothetical protein